MYEKPRHEDEDGKTLSPIGLSEMLRPVGKNQEEFGIEITGPVFEGFAQNDLYHVDPQGADHPKYAKGLKRALDAYLNKAEFNEDLQTWFDFPVRPTRHAKDLIEGFLI